MNAVLNVSVKVKDIDINMYILVAKLAFKNPILYIKRERHFLILYPH